MNLSRFWVRDPIRAYRPQLRFCLRTTVAGLLALAVARSFNFPLHGLWAVLTAVVVTQVSVGGSVRATIEYVIGTLSGAVYAAAIGVLIPHTTVISQAGVLVLAVAPLSLAAAINPSFRVAPFSAVIVLLIGGELGETPIVAAVTRVLEVAVGGAVAMVVSLLVFPERVHKLGLGAAAKILRQMADVLPKHERIVTLTRNPEPAPLSRTLLRLRHDLVILARAAARPLPEALAQRLGPLIARVAATASEFLRESATALVEHRDPPLLAPGNAALTAFDSEVVALRSEGLTRPLSTDEVERLFALGFALDQLFRDFADLAQRVQEYAQGKGPQNKS